MSFSDSLIESLNSTFANHNIPFQILEFICWRPAYREVHFQDFEPLTDITRLFECNPVYVTLFFRFEDRRYEYEVHYKNSDKHIELVNFILNTCDYGPDEDVTLIENRMNYLVGMLVGTSIPGELRMLYETEKEGD